MEKLLEKVKQNLREIGEQELTLNNLDAVDKLVDIYKDIEEIKKMEGGRMDYRDSNNGGYRNSYWNGDYNDYGRNYPYERRNGGYRDNRGGGYRDGGYNNGMREKMDRVMDGFDQYEYGRDRYMHGDSEERIFDGLEKLMYALCVFVESAMEFAETPQEKEIIRKHIQKLSRI